MHDYALSAITVTLGKWRQYLYRGWARTLIGRYQRTSHTGIFVQIEQHSDNYYSQISFVNLTSSSEISHWQLYNHNGYLQTGNAERSMQADLSSNKVQFCPKNPDIRKSVVLFFFWGFQVLPACACDKSSMILEHWWSNTDEVNPKY